MAIYGIYGNFDALRKMLIPQYLMLLTNLTFETIVTAGSLLISNYGET